MKMVELTISQIIKIIIIVLVIIVVVIAVYFAFKNYIIPYFEGIVPSNNLVNKLILSLMR